MSTNLYDNYGWYTTDVVYIDRHADVSPGSVPTSKEVGEPYPNWTGYAWIDIPYYTVEPILQSIPINITSVGLLKQIDLDTDLLYGAVIGNRAMEYQQAETEATAFTAQGGTAPPCVTSWAQAKGWTNEQAAADILSTAAAWRAAQQLIRSTRLSLKEATRSAANTSALLTIQTTWVTFVSTMRTNLGL